MAAANAVYNVTTVQEPKAGKWLIVPSEYLDKCRFGIKVAAVLFSLVAFILEEVVLHCKYCPPLYFFEFVSCTAFLFTGLLVVLLSTPLHQRVGISCWLMLDFSYTVVVGLLFLIASAAFAKDNGGSAVEKTSVAFGFIATLLFLVDAVVLAKTKGLPCLSKAQPAQTQNQTAEGEKLNATGSE
ncbi:CKLF-like MARVEL transmembrane domain-containing protein 6 isoform X2 [Brienomyrus brachyistius]|uniref:CKLF-like MARVEL transmembrane domain-containing protein 6 isoform X2 n=1 Tax=Brienomyrus brachyistius TaxID=42636 RepID=UPI0020B2D9CF|nr:CKLF-like MARVEL transmembrane domain-containing protein 6 isoform X2 [Brienomyrus brachyistius]